MYYCTVYNKNTAKDSWRAVCSLAYASKADAANYAADLAEQAFDCGAQIDEQNNAYIITGTTHFNIGGFNKTASKTFYYMVNVEDKTSCGYLSSNIEAEEVYIEDGFKFEKRAAKHRGQLSVEYNKEREKINYNLSRFEQEIANETDLTKILTILLKYAGQKTDKQKLIALAVNKIQGGGLVEESDWYNELSDINN